MSFDDLLAMKGMLYRLGSLPIALMTSISSFGRSISWKLEAIRDAVTDFGMTL